MEDRIRICLIFVLPALFQMGCFYVSGDVWMESQPKQLGYAQSSSQEENWHSLQARQRLYTFVTDPSYRREVNPSNVTIYFGLKFNCPYFDSARGIATTRVLKYMAWSDKRIQWNPREYNEETLLQMPTTRLWVPDISHYNALEPEKQSDVLLLIRYNGYTQWMPPSTVKSLCRDNGYNITCKYQFGSWSYDRHSLHLQAIEFPEVSFGDDCPYELLNKTIESKSVSYNCCDQPFDYVETTITISKKD